MQPKGFASISNQKAWDSPMLQSDGTQKNDRKGQFIQTYSGKQFYPTDPQIDDINIIDIAQALSNVCRFAGHALCHYNVAQHSTLVSRNVSERAALFGLLHDAPEAFIGDVSRPIKRILRELCGDAFDKIENKIMEVICRKYVVLVDDEIRAEVKKADDILLATERRDFMRKVNWDWANDKLPEPLPEMILQWNQGTAYYAFLKRFYELTGRAAEDIV